MMAITLPQPRATLLARGILSVINSARPLGPGVHGEVIALHASSAPHDPLAPDLDRVSTDEARRREIAVSQLPRGKIVGVAKVIASAAPEVVARALPEFASQCGGPVCTVLHAPVELQKPVSAVGERGLWYLSTAEEELVRIGAARSLAAAERIAKYRAARESAPTVLVPEAWSQWARELYVAVLHAAGVSDAQVRSRSRTAAIVAARRAFAYAASRPGPERGSYPQIAAVMGFLSHSSALHQASTAERDTRAMEIVAKLPEQFGVPRPVVAGVGVGVGR